MTEGRRWYEINPILKDAITAWEYFPLNLQRSLAKYVHQLIRNNELPMRYKGLSGLLIHLVIMRDNMKKNRWYDKDKTVQNTLNTLPHVEIAALVDVALRINKLRAYVRDKPVPVHKMSDDEILKEIDYVFKNPTLV